MYSSESALNNCGISHNMCVFFVVSCGVHTYIYVYPVYVSGVSRARLVLAACEIVRGTAIR